MTGKLGVGEDSMTTMVMCARTPFFLTTLHVQFHHPFTAVFGVITHSVPTVDQFLRVEWTAAFPLWTLNLAQRDTVHGARCSLHAVFA
jgi:hypothetical protein